MRRTIESLIADIDAFTPQRSDSVGNLAVLYPLAEEMEDHRDAVQAVEPVFRFFERNPSAHLGSPGPLVLFLERRPDYQKALIASLQRRPTLYAIEMVNRILCNELPRAETQYWVDVLQRVADHPDAGEAERETAKKTIKLHRRWL